MDWNSPLIIAPAMALFAGVVGWVISMFNNKKAKIEADSKKEALLAELEILKIQTDIAEQERLKAIKLAEVTAAVIKDIAEKQDAMAITVEETHKLSNSSKTKMESIEQDLRAKLEAAELAKHIAVEAERLAKENANVLATAELKIRDAKIEELQRQVLSLAIATPVSPAGTMSPA